MHGVREVSWGFGKRDFLQEKRDIQGKKKKVLPAWKQPCEDGDGKEGSCPVILRGNIADAGRTAEGEEPTQFLNHRMRPRSSPGTTCLRLLVK